MESNNSPKPNKTIYLLTDFGFEGQNYVTQMRGVIYNLVPLECRVEDITHAVEPFSIIQAEFFLITTFSYLVHPCIIIVVVDPGVGTGRDIVAILDEEGNILIGPNNGVFGRFPPRKRISEVRKVDNPNLVAKLGSMTFQGRDVMAPVAAWLAKDLPFSEVGSLAGSLIVNPLPSPEVTRNIATGGIYSIDSFGNVITNIPANYIRNSNLKSGSLIHVQVEGGVEEDFQFGTTFSDVQIGDRVAYVGSSLFLELGVNQGSAAVALECNIGDRIRLEWE